MSEAQWHYLHAGQRIGPIGQEQMIELFRSGAMPLSTMVQSDWFGYWVPASSIGGFRSVVAGDVAAPGGEGATNLRPAPATLDTALPQGPSPDHAPGPENYVPCPWRRWAARWIDQTLALILWTALLSVLAPLASPTLLTRVVLFFAIFPALFVLTEAAMLYAFGATPGKALFGVIVREPGGDVLSFSRAVHRSFRVFVQGIGLGLPVLSLCTVIAGYFSLKDGGVTAWDRAGQFSVTHHPTGVAQRLTALLILAGALVIHFRTLAIALHGS